MQHFLGGIFRPPPSHFWKTQLHMQCYQALKKSSPLFLESFLFRKEVKEVSGCFFSVWEEQTNIHTYSIIAKLLLKLYGESVRPQYILQVVCPLRILKRWDLKVYERTNN